VPATTIRKIEIYALAIPLREPFQIALQTATVAENVFVRVTTENGIEGWGEASPLHAVTGETVDTCIAAGRFVAERLRGRDAVELSTLQNEMASELPHNTSLRSAFDMALHDVAARAAGMPLFRFLGGSPRELITDITLGIGEAEATIEKARRAADMGFRNLKIKMGLDAWRDLRVVEGIRSTLGPATSLRLDANQAWERHEAVANLGRMAEHGIQFCEQPVPHHDVSGLDHVARLSPVAVMADEAAFGPHEMLRLVRETTVPYVNLKVAKAGGLRPTLQSDTIAHAGGLQAMLGCMMESRLGLSASVHLALACQSVRFLDLDTVFELAEDPIVGGVTYEGERITSSEAPGIGAVLDVAGAGARLMHLVE